ncbi:MAG: VOC family protein [Acidobacteriota bacterium]|nr:VOC family protein [Acidobacteriota bacterium]
MNAPFYFEIQADNPPRAVAFYKKVFGWSFEKVEGLPSEYWRIQTVGIRGGLLQRPAAVPPPPAGTNAYVCSMEVKNFDETARAIEAAGGIVAMPKFAVSRTCWQGYFVDTEGNTFGLFQPDPGAR